MQNSGVGGIAQRQPNARYFAFWWNISLRVCVGSKIPRCWYPQRQILASGALPNAKPRHQVFCVAVEYRLKAYIPLRRKNICVGSWRWLRPPTPEFRVGGTNMLVSENVKRPTPNLKFALAKRQTPTPVSGI